MEMALTEFSNKPISQLDAKRILGFNLDEVYPKDLNWNMLIKWYSISDDEDRWTRVLRGATYKLKFVVWGQSSREPTVWDLGYIYKENTRDNKCVRATLVKDLELAYIAFDMGANPYRLQDEYERGLAINFAFVWACIRGNAMLVSQLLDDKSGVLALRFANCLGPTEACIRGHHAVIKLLLRDVRFNPATDFRNLGDKGDFYKAVAEGHYGVVLALIRDQRVGPASKQALRIAKQNGYKDILTLLLQDESTLQSIGEKQYSKDLGLIIDQPASIDITKETDRLKRLAGLHKLLASGVHCSESSEDNKADALIELERILEHCKYNLDKATEYHNDLSASKKAKAIIATVNIFRRAYKRGDSELCQAMLEDIHMVEIYGEQDDIDKLYLEIIKQREVLTEPSKLQHLPVLNNLTEDTIAPKLPVIPLIVQSPYVISYKKRAKLSLSSKKVAENP